jgi:hypothetical protein
MSKLWLWLIAGQSLLTQARGAKSAEAHPKIQQI